MQRFALVFSICLLCAMNAQAVFVNGQAYLSGQGNHENIRVIFEAVSPSAETDTTYTNPYGAFSATLEPGVYNALYSHSGYADYRLPNQVLLWDTTLDPVTLLPPLSGYLSGSLGPGDFQVTDSIVVGTGQNLTIQPGTRLFFEGFHRFVVRGLLSAIGTEQDSIVFTRRYSVGSDTVWRGIHFLNASDVCRMDYSLVEHGGGDGYVFYHGGGGVFCQSCDLELNSCVFRSNEPMAGGYAGGALLFVDSNPQISSCVFSENRGDVYGGGIYCRNASISISGCYFYHNLASNGGAVLLDDGSHAVIGGSTFIDNTVYSGDPDIYIMDGDAVINKSVFLRLTRDGVCINLGSNSMVSQCTFFGPGSDYYGMIEVTGTAIVTSCSIFTTAGPAICFDGAAESQIRYCDIFAPNGQEFLNPGWGPPAIGLIALTNPNGDSCDTYYNIFLDPQLVDTANGDYHLMAGSPCIDAGDPELSLDPDGTVADIGAFYFDQLNADDPERTAVRRYELLQNYPNPFNSTTQIVFDVPRAEHAAITVYDVTGRQVTTLFSGMATAGRNTVSFSAEDLPSGIYFCRLAAGDARQTRKLILMK